MDVVYLHVEVFVGVADAAGDLYIEVHNGLAVRAARLNCIWRSRRVVGVLVDDRRFRHQRRLIRDRVQDDVCQLGLAGDGGADVLGVVRVGVDGIRLHLDLERSIGVIRSHELDGAEVFHRYLGRFGVAAVEHLHRVPF